MGEYQADGDSRRLKFHFSRPSFMKKLCFGCLCCFAGSLWGELSTVAQETAERSKGFLGVADDKLSHFELDGFELPISATSHIFYRVEVGDSPQAGGSLKYTLVSGGVPLPIDRIRFLAIKKVQDELNLSEKTLDQLKPVIEMLDRYEQVDRWGSLLYGQVAVESARKSAEENVKKLIDETAVIETGKVLSATQILRLEQIRLRFHCMGTSGASDGFDLPREFVREKLQLTPAQEAAIRDIVESELKDLFELGTQVDDICRVLPKEQSGILNRCFHSLRDHQTSVGMSLAHCQDDLFPEPMPDSQEIAWTPILVQRAILTLSGQFAAEDVYLERGSLNVPFPWRRVIAQVESGGLEWLQLSDSQREEILDLKMTEDGTTRYYGFDVYSSMMRGDKPEADWTPEQLERWKEKFREAWGKADEKLGERLKEIFLQRQLELLGSAVMIQRILDLGPYYLVLKFKFAGLEIPATDLKKVEALRSERLARLQKIFERIEVRVRHEFSLEQRRWVERHFGDYCPLYPAVWLFLVP